MEVKLFDGSIEKFIQSLEKSTIAKVLRTIDLLERFGYQLGLPYSRKIINQLFELRVRGAQEVRLFYVFDKGDIVLLYGFIKKSQKTPRREIRVALARLKSLTSNNA